MKSTIGGTPSPRSRWVKGKLPYYRDVVLFGLGACLIVGTASQFEQWFSEHKVIHLEFCFSLLLIACAYFALIPNRIFVAIGSLEIVVLLGVVGSVLNQTLVLIPLALGCAVAAFLLIKYKGSTIKLK